MAWKEVQTVDGPRWIKFEPAGDFREYRRQWCAWDEDRTLYADPDRSLERREERRRSPASHPRTRVWNPETRCWERA